MSYTTSTHLHCATAGLPNTRNRWTEVLCGIYACMVHVQKMRFIAFLCLFALLAFSSAAFPIKTRNEEGPNTANIQKTTLYDMIFGRDKLQKPTSKFSGQPVHVHDGMHVLPHSKPSRKTLHVQRRLPPSEKA